MVGNVHQTVLGVANNHQKKKKIKINALTQIRTEDLHITQLGCWITSVALYQLSHKGRLL